jgi:hypothetical protein
LFTSGIVDFVAWIGRLEEHKEKEQKGGPAGLTGAAFYSMLRANLRAAQTGLETSPSVGVALTTEGGFW